MNRLLRSWVAVSVLTLACGSPEAVDDAGVGRDATPSDATLPDAAPAELCERDRDCSDEIYCNGDERCAPTSPEADARGCAPSPEPRCEESQSCDEEMRRCFSDCDVESDADGDGIRAVECGGDDCDDADPVVYPGAPELCDAEGRDEDCDPTTLGPDMDGDGVVAAGCCNQQADGGNLCGRDCNDMNGEVNPDAIEVCNGLDDNCDGMLDPTIEDADGDGWAGCADLPASSRDCDDDAAMTFPGAPELCDGLDNDCDGSAVGEDLDGDGYLASGVACAGGSRASLPRSDCDDTESGINPGAVEVCDAIDHDCDMSTDEAPASTSCPSDARTTYACASSSCAVSSCGGGYDDCDGTASNGCEQRLDVVDHCGSCGNACVWTCDMSSCADPVAVAAAYDHSCAVTSSGRVRCWGGNDSGQLGIGTMSATPEARPASEVQRVTMPIGVGPLQGVDEVDGGLFFSCARLASGEVLCWGADDRGQLGQGSTSPSPRPLARRLLHRDGTIPFDDAVALGVGASHACAVLRGGGVACWGSNDDLQAGGGDNPQTTARSVPGVTGASAVSSGNESTCALLSSGRVSCWGSNDSGQLGRGMVAADTASPAEVVAVAGPGALTGIDQVAVGDDHACALTSSGEVLCWGANDYGQLGDGTTTASARPVYVRDGAARLGAVTEISAGWTHTCALLSTGGVRCWGRNQVGQLGDGTTSSRSQPVAVLDGTGPLAGVTSLANADLHSCASRSGELVCWGLNASAQLGDGTRTTRVVAGAVLPPL